MARSLYYNELQGMYNTVVTAKKKWGKVQNQIH